MKGERIFKASMAQFLIAALILSSFVTFAFAEFADKKPRPTTDYPINMHLSWNSSDTTHTIVVSWQTAGNIASEVQYDTVSHGGINGTYAYSATGSAHGWPTNKRPSGYVHDVLLTGLTPDTVYYCICGSASGGYSAEYGFQTAPTGTTASFSFVAGGDSRSDQTNRELVSKAMAQKSPRFIIHCGDYMDSDRARYYAEWMSDVNSNWVTPENLRIPMWGCIGNHEGAGTCILGQYAWPSGPSNNERWYSVDYGDLIHIIVLSNCYDTVDSQTAWLQTDLQANQNKPWKFAIFHEPAYVSGSYTNRTDVVQAWSPLLEQYGVNIVFAGHCHIYQRTYPLMGSPNAQVASNPADGTNYVVSAGWGAPLYTGTYAPWVAYTESIYEYCLIQVNGSTSLTLTMYDQSNVAHDSFTITKT